MGAVRDAPGSVDEVALRDLRDEDIPVIVPMYRRAFRGGVDDALGDAYVRALLRWFAADPGTVARVAVFDETPVAFSLGAPNGYRRRLLRSMLPTMLRCLITRPRAVLRSLSVPSGREAGAERPDPGTIFHFKVLEVEPDWRRGGLARVVSDDFVSHVFRAGFRRITATTHKDNTAVLKLMERVGYRAIDGGTPAPDGRRLFALDRKPRAQLRIERLERSAPGEREPGS